MTLIEILFALTIFVWVMAAVFSFMLSSLKIFYKEGDKLSIHQTMRSITNDMMEKGTFATNSVIFDSYASRSTPKTNGQAGDCLVFYNYRMATDSLDTTKVKPTTYINDIVCYYLTPLNASSPHGEQVLKKLYGTVSSGSTITSVDAAITAVANDPTTKPAKVITGVIRSTDTASSSEPSLFYYDNARTGGMSSVVATMAFSMGTTRPGYAAKSVNLYSFSITSRH